MKLIVFALLLFPFLSGFGSNHSSLKSTADVSGDEVTLQFKISANSDMVLTHQAPWQITLTNFKDLDLPLKADKYVSKDYDEKLPGFTVKTKIKGGSANGSIDYKMKAFVCTKDKSRCYPQSHKGTVTWKKS